MSNTERMGLAAAELVPAPTRVRYQVVAVSCVLAVLTYINRLGFGVAGPEIKTSLGLSSEQMGYLGSAFLIAYGLFQVPGGLLGDRFGGRHVLTGLVLVWSLLSGITALAFLFPATAGPDRQVILGSSGITALGLLFPATMAFVFLLAVRFLFGMFQAGQFPCQARVMADWMPLTERARAQGIVWMFSRLGGALVPFIFGGLLVLFGTWTTPFVVMAGLGVLWCAGFWPWFRNRPEEMASVNSSELALIASGRSAAPAGRGPVPWSKILGSVNVWALCSVYGFIGFAGNFFTSPMLPDYLRDHRDLTGWTYSILVSLPLAFGIAACVLGGFLSDWIIRRWHSRKWGRRLIGAVGLVVGALCMLCVPFVEEIWLLALLLATTFFCNDLSMGPAWAACADVGESYAGTVSGAMNMLGSVAGAAGTAFAGYFFDRNQVPLVFMVFAGSYVLAALSWLAVDVTRPLLEKTPA
jgi:sugar phosphate permease